MTMMAAAWDIPVLVSQLRVDSDPITIVDAFQELRGRALRESEEVAASAILGGAGGIAATISVMKEFPRTETIQACGCLILQNAADFNENCKRDIYSGGGVE
jgi:hypothetical protein